MSFIRDFSDTQIQRMAGDNKALFDMLKADILNGDVFPAVRKNELHFYYMGGCLYKFVGGRFTRDKNFEKFGVDKSLSEYDNAKRQIEIKFANNRGKDKERRLLSALNKHTFDSAYGGDVVVLDIEVNLNGTVGGGKKCDLVLLNKSTDEIMFVEGKVFSDSRVNVAVSFTPEVIEQVNTYTYALKEQNQNILVQYGIHIDIINRIFGTSFRAPKRLIEPCKLLVYGTPLERTKNGEYTVSKINEELGASNVFWVGMEQRPPLDDIWRALTL